MASADIISFFLTSSFVAAIVSGFVAFNVSDRKIEIKNITEERAKWRDRIRGDARDICREYENGTLNKVLEFKVIFSVNLNQNDCNDMEIVNVIDQFLNYISSGNRVKNGLTDEFTIRISLLLKHDWERAKYEAKPWWKKLFCFKPDRVSYSEFLQKNKNGSPRPWFRARL
jgi:hypothetical protein